MITCVFCRTHHLGKIPRQYVDYHYHSHLLLSMMHSIYDVLTNHAHLGDYCHCTTYHKLIIQTLIQEAYRQNARNANKCSQDIIVPLVPLIENDMLENPIMIRIKE